MIYFSRFFHQKIPTMRRMIAAMPMPGIMKALKLLMAQSKRL